MSTVNPTNHSIEPAKKKAKKTKAASTVVKLEGTKDDDKNKSPNFHSDEDELLAVAWVSATDNPVVGVGQKAITFWADVHGRYCKLQEKSVSPETKFPRSWNQLKGRFLRHIQLNVNVFNRYYKKAADNIPSGHNSTVSSIMDRAMEEYQVDQGKPFRFSLCVPILHKIPKFDPMTSEVLADNQPATSTTAVASVMGSTLPRPIGTKAAKAFKKEETTTYSNVKEIKSDIKQLVDSTIRKEAFQELIALGKYYRSIGDNENAMMNHKALQDLVDENRQARQATKKDVPSIVVATEVSTLISSAINPPDDSSVSSVEIIPMAAIITAVAAPAVDDSSESSVEILKV
jgi:hypothetical protein